MLELLSNTDFHQLIVSAYQSIREARLLKVTQVALSERDTALQLIALFRREV